MMDSPTEAQDDKPAPDSWVTATSSLSFLAFVEYAALCLEGRLHLPQKDALIASIDGRERSYDVTTTSDGDGDGELTIASSDAMPKSFELDKAVDVQRLMLGLHRLNIQVKASGKLAPLLPAQKFYKSIKPDDMLTGTDSEQVHPDCHLTLRDLREIAVWMERLQADESAATSDQSFSTFFPSNYRDSLRHRSGTEVILHRDQEGIVKFHRVDAPNPAEYLFSAWCASEKRKPPAMRGDASLRWKRWRLAKMLGTIPENHKSAVFNWVTDVMQGMDENESTYGRTRITSPLEYSFDNYIIFLNDSQEFELLHIA